MYKPSLHFVTVIRLRFLRQRNEMLSDMSSALRGFVAAWLEILTTSFVYMPEVLYSPLRLWLAVKSLLVGKAAWKVQAEVEFEFQHKFLYY